MAYDFCKNEFTGDEGKKEKLLKKFENVQEIIFIKKITEVENDISFKEWLENIVDAENDINHGVKKAEEDLYELQENFPKYMDVWVEALDNMIISM